MAKLNKNLLNILVCPVSKGKLVYDEENNELICEESKLAYPHYFLGQNLQSLAFD